MVKKFSGWMESQEGYQTYHIQVKAEQRVIFCTSKLQRLDNHAFPN